MILLFQINPCASESVLALEHMRSFFECVLCDYYHHDVRTISAMMLERIADARQRGGGLSLPPESLFSLASRIEDQLASAKQCTPGGARTPGWQAEPQTSLPLTRVCASPWTDGLQTGMVSLLVKAAAFHAPCSQAPYKLQEKFGDMQVVTSGRRRRLQAGAAQPAAAARQLQPADGGGMPERPRTTRGWKAGCRAGLVCCSCV